MLLYCAIGHCLLYHVASYCMILYHDSMFVMYVYIFAPTCALNARAPHPCQD